MVGWVRGGNHCEVGQTESEDYEATVVRDHAKLQPRDEGGHRLPSNSDGPGIMLRLGGARVVCCARRMRLPGNVIGLTTHDEEWTVG